MKLQIFRTYLERLSFFLWIAFTIFSLSLAGVGLEGMILAGYMFLVSGTQPVLFPLAMVFAGGLGIFLSIFWRKIGIDHLHYSLHDSAPYSEGEDEAPSHVLEDLIRKVETSEGYARNDERIKAKAWLISHASSLDEEDILLAKAHFGYMLPSDWGV